MNRRLAATATLVLALIGCSDRPATPPAPIPTSIPTALAKLEATTVGTSRLTATGGYEYTIQIQLTERGGFAATITRMDAVALVDGEFIGSPGVSVSGPEPWIGDTNIIAANGTLTSKPLTINDESPWGYAEEAYAWFTYSDANSSGRSFSVTVRMPPQPGPPSEARVTLNGVVTDYRTDTPLPGVLVKVLNGPDAGRQATTDGSGRFALASLRTGRFRLEFTSKDLVGESHYQTVFIIADQTMTFRLHSKLTSASPVP